MGVGKAEVAGAVQGVRPEPDRVSQHLLRNRVGNGAGVRQIALQLNRHAALGRVVRQHADANRLGDEMIVLGTP